MATHIAELQAFSVKELKNRARELGAPAQEIDDLDAAADVKTAAIQLVLQHDKDLPDDQRAELMKLSIKEPTPATEKVEPRNTETAGLVPACLIPHAHQSVSHSLVNCTRRERRSGAIPLAASKTWPAAVTSDAAPVAPYATWGG